MVLHRYHRNLFFLEVVDAFVDDDPFEPSPKSAVVFKARQVFKGIHKTVLYNILRIFFVPQHSHTNIVHGIHIERIQLVLRAAMACLAFFNKCLMCKTNIGFQ